MYVSVYMTASIYILTAGMYYVCHEELERLFDPPWKASDSGSTDVSKNL